ncbi:hypothetical protein [Novosphingobium lentum]|uniref:hypothetical protein n=1 Tax=Novosphingobium lentum TaxID=145287 RepID=UPI00082D97C0|nr:hypothetical protein [Novosphingobium lentum]
MVALRLPSLPKANRKAALAILSASAGAVALALAGIVGVPALLAQIEGDRGIAPVASNGDIEITGIEVETTGDTAEEARQEGWKQAQRKAWEKLWANSGGGKAPAVADETIASVVSAVEVEREQLGPHRYIATLTVVFDRARTGEQLGNQGAVAHSAPMLVIPVLYDGGVASVFETRTPWQKAWAEFRTGGSVIDYVRPNGGSSDSLLLTAGQLDRRSRAWWRLVLDEFGASDVLMPIARLDRQWPGGPVHGTFSARFGPDNKFIGSFTMTAPNEAAVPAMLSQAIARLDGLYGGALSAGQLAPDPTLNLQQQVDQNLINQILDTEAPAPRATGPAAVATGATPSASASASAAPASATYTVQFATPDADAVDAGMAAVRGAAGVQGVSTSSIAIGGTSVMRVTYAGDLDALAAALRSAGFKVTQGAGALSIRK